MKTQVWNMFEKLYPDTEVWETETPVFSSRNYNFYVNKCGFHIIKMDNPKNRLAYCLYYIQVKNSSIKCHPMLS